MARQTSLEFGSVESPHYPVNPMRRILVDGLRRVESALLPPRCQLCTGAGAPARDLCAACFDDLVHNHNACARCALPLSIPAPLCGECLHRLPPFDAAFAPFEYAHPLDLLLTRLKFGRSLAAGRVIADLWMQTIRLALADGRIAALPDVLLPVPLHATRLRERGYNQALELAKPIAAALHLPIAPDMLRRERATTAQTGLDAVARRRSLRGAFVFVAPLGAPPARVALVDDVMTTGATLRECARVLKRAGVARVEVWAFARAPRLR